MTTVTLTEFRKRVSGFLSDVGKGNVIVIMRHGKPVAELRPVASGQAREPSWKRPRLRLSVVGAGLSKAVREGRHSA